MIVEARPLSCRYFLAVDDVADQLTYQLAQDAHVLSHNLIMTLDRESRSDGVEKISYGMRLGQGGPSPASLALRRGGRRERVLRDDEGQGMDKRRSSWP